MGPRNPSALLVFCPNGHRIEVDQKYRGLTGKCPKCKSPFFVPVLATSGAKTSEETPVEEPPPVTGFGPYTHWLDDVRIHSLNPERLKLKAGSLKGDFQFYDLALGSDEMAAVTYTKKKGSAAVKPKKRQKDRESVQETLGTGGTVEDSAAVASLKFPGDQAASIAVVQPAAYAHDSMFAGIPVFGEGRIAVRLPAGDDPARVLFASFTLTGFRQFATAMREAYGYSDLGHAEGIPLTDVFAEGPCHYSEETLRFLEDPQYHEADADIKLQRVGRKCQECGLLVSEDMRKKEKIGGANGKSIAKAKCPKCSQKFGSISLYTIEAPESEDESSESPEAEVAAAGA